MMNLLFETKLPVRSGKKLSNHRIVFNQTHYFTRADISFENMKSGTTAQPQAYLENLNALKQLLPLPEFMLKPLLKLQTGYEKAEVPVQAASDKIVLYMHGAGGLAEENTILHQMLLASGYTVIRISYSIDYNKNGLVQPQRIEEMPEFLNLLSSTVVPELTEELDNVLAAVQKELKLTWENKSIILIAHSLGAGILLNYAVEHPEMKVDKYINLDGTILQPAIAEGFAVPQLHLSQSQQFDISWLKDDRKASPSQELGKDYGMRIQALLKASGAEYRWIQVTDATHFTFTDFPYVLKPYKFIRKLAGSRDASDRIRAYVMAFVNGAASSIILQKEDKEINDV